MSRNYFLWVFPWAFGTKKEQEGSSNVVLMHKPVKSGREGGCWGIWGSWGSCTLGLAGFNIGHSEKLRVSSAVFPLLNNKWAILEYKFLQTTSQTPLNAAVAHGQETKAFHRQPQRMNCWRARRILVWQCLLIQMIMQEYWCYPEGSMGFPTAANLDENIRGKKNKSKTTEQALLSLISFLLCLEKDCRKKALVLV